jgi:hypothetical protein
MSEANGSGTLGGFGFVVDLFNRVHRVRLVFQCRDDPS